jgi:hypothetical protein
LLLLSHNPLKPVKAPSLLNKLSQTLFCSNNWCCFGFLAVLKNWEFVPEIAHTYLILLSNKIEPW